MTAKLTPKCDGDCFNCILPDCNNSSQKAVNDLEIQIRKDGQKRKQPDGKW